MPQYFLTSEQLLLSSSSLPLIVFFTVFQSFSEVDSASLAAHYLILGRGRALGFPGCPFSVTILVTSGDGAFTRAVFCNAIDFWLPLRWGEKGNQIMLG